MISRMSECVMASFSIEFPAIDRVVMSVSICQRLEGEYLSTTWGKVGSGNTNGRC